MVHVPLWQADVAAQALLHAPQLPWSLSTLTHWAPASPVVFAHVSGSAGEHLQMPALQTAPVGQMVVHVPQWSGFVSRSTHCVPHRLG
jgi:hypothetical protein